MNNIMGARESYQPGSSTGNSPTSLLFRWLTAYAAAAALAGWGLSAAGLLASVPAVAVAVLLLTATFASITGALSRSVRWPRAARFRRGLPCAWLALAALATAGALAHPVVMLDHHTYRLPRVLHWLDAGGWGWIETPVVRMNFSASAVEWMSVPPLVLFGTDRSVALANLLGFALMPGLVFAVLRALGAGGRGAWVAMWTLPAAHVFALQAGGGATDALGAAFALGALAHALRARGGADLAVAVLAAAIFTNIKASNLPLLLPLAVALVPAVRRVRPRSGPAAALLVVALGCSFAPHAVLNARHTGSWTGDPENTTRMRLASPLAGLAGNALQIGVGLLEPPAFPFAKRWNDAWRARLTIDAFPRLDLDLRELPSEDRSGAGVGVTLVALAWLLGSRGRRRRPLPRALLAAHALALAALMASLGSPGLARLAAPYYPLALGAAFLLPGPVRGRSGALRAALALAFAGAALVLVLTPSRPLWPWRAVLPPGRARTVYETYAKRSDALAAVRDALPPAARVIGVVANLDFPTSSLWRGGRRVVWAVRDPPPCDVLVVREPDPRAAALPVLARVSVVLRVQDGPEEIAVRATSPPPPVSPAR
jgi:hypothetical protein